MGLNLGSIFVELKAETLQFKKDMDAAGASVKGFTDGLKPIAVASAAAFAGLAAGTGVALRAANESIQAETRLSSALRAAGESTDTTPYTALASQLQGLTTFEDDATVNSMAFMKSMGLNQEQVLGLTPLVQDLSAAYGIDLQSAAMAVGKAVEGNAGGLARYGVQLSDSEKKTFEMGNQATRAQMIMDKLTSSVGGTAQAMADTPMGRFTQAMNEAGNAMEEVGFVLGDMLKPYLEAVRDRLQGVTEWFRNLTPESKALFGKLVLVATALAGVSTFVTGVALALPGLITGFGALAVAVNTALLPITAIAVGLGLIVAGASTLAGLVNRVQSGKAGESGNVGTEFMASFKEGLAPVLDPIRKAFAEMIPSLAGAQDGVMDFSGAAKDMAPIVFDTGVKLKGMGQNAEAAGKVFSEWDPGEVWGPGMDAIPEAYVRVAQKSEGGWMTKLDTAYADLTARRSAAEQKRIDDLAMAGKAAGESFQAEAVNFSTTFADSIVATLGTTGEVIRAGIQGFQSAGPWGAIAAIIATLLSKGPAFQQFIDLLNRWLMMFVMALNPIVKAMLPILEIFLNVLQIWLIPIKLIAALFVLFAPLIRALAGALEWVMRAIFDTWNWIVTTLADWASNIPVVGGALHDALSSLAFDYADLGVDVAGSMDAMIASAKNWSTDVVKPTENLGKETGKAAEQMRELSESMTNVPEGFKIALARFRATEGEAYPGSSGGASGQVQGPSWFAGSVINVYANDPKKFKDELEKETRWANFRRTGSPITAAPAFAGAK